MKFRPTNDTVLCRISVRDESETKSDGIIVTEKRLPEYEVLDVCLAINPLDLKPGDVVICNSTGTRFDSEDAEYYLFKGENVAGKVI